jgi:hypothetical protein
VNIANQSVHDRPALHETDLRIALHSSDVSFGHRFSASLGDRPAGLLGRDDIENGRKGHAATSRRRSDSMSIVETTEELP